jgi:hypothetical protein
MKSKPTHFCGGAAAMPILDRGEFYGLHFAERNRA